MKWTKDACPNFWPRFLCTHFLKVHLIRVQSWRKSPCLWHFQGENKKFWQSSQPWGKFQVYSCLNFLLFTTHYQTELKDRFCLLLCRLHSVLTGDHSWWLEYLATRLSVQPYLMDSRSAKCIRWRVCTSAEGMCGCAHIRQREKLLCACSQPNYLNSFVEEFFPPSSFCFTQFKQYLSEISGS